MLPFMIAAAIGGAGGVGIALTDNKIKKSFDEWKNSYSRDEQNKLNNIGKIYSVHIYPCLTEKERDLDNKLDFKVEICQEASGYSIGKNDLHKFQIHSKIQSLCKEQNKFSKSRYFFTNIHTIENLILEDYKIWLVKLSNLKTEDVDDKLKLEIDKRLQCLEKIVFMEVIEDWQAGFLDVIRALRDYIEPVLREVEKNIARYKTKNILKKLVLEEREFVTNMLEFLCNAMENNELKGSLTDKSASGLAANSSLLKEDFYGQLILYVIGTENFQEALDLRVVVSNVAPLPIAKSKQKENFVQLTQEIRKFVQFFHICIQFNNTDSLGGRLLVKNLMKSRDRIENVSDAFALVKEKLLRLLQEISDEYKKEIRELHDQVKVWEKELFGYCCKYDQIKRAKKGINKLTGNENRMSVAKDRLKSHLDQCQMLLSEIKTFAIEADESEMQEFKKSMQGLVKSVSIFISGVQGIEYHDEIDINLGGNNRLIFSSEGNQVKKIFEKTKSLPYETNNNNLEKSSSPTMGAQKRFQSSFMIGSNSNLDDYFSIKEEAEPQENINENGQKQQVAGERGSPGNVMTLSYNLLRTQNLPEGEVPLAQQRTQSKFKTN